MTQNVQTRLGLSEAPACLEDVFDQRCSITHQLYMARGIYHPEDTGDGCLTEDSVPEPEDATDGNHTFGVVAHTVANTFYFSVMECVSAVLVLRSEDEARNTSVCNIFNAEIQRALPESTPLTYLDVMSTQQAASMYKHVFWVDEYMVFEYAPCIREGRTEMLLSFGAATYHQYRCCLKIDADALSEVMLALHQTLDDTVLQEGLVVLITQPIFYHDEVYTFLKSKTRRAQFELCPRAQDAQTPGMLRELYLEYQFMSIFSQSYVMQAYQDNLSVSGANTATFFQLHPDLLDMRKATAVLFHAMLYVDRGDQGVKARTLVDGVSCAPVHSHTGRVTMLPALAVPFVKELLLELEAASVFLAQMISESCAACSLSEGANLRGDYARALQPRGRCVGTLAGTLDNIVGIIETRLHGKVLTALLDDVRTIKEARAKQTLLFPDCYGVVEALRNIQKKLQYGRDGQSLWLV